MFSIIIPALNEEKFLPRLLDSLTLLSTRDFEVIVVDGSSKDRTVAVAKSFVRKLPKLTVLESKIANTALQRNMGANVARGQWLVFADADTQLLPYFFERLKGFIEERNPSLFTTWFRSDSENAGDAMLTLFTNMYIEGSIIFKRPLSPGPLTIVTKKIFDDVGGYDESLVFGEDYDFGRRVTERGIPFHVLRESLCVFSLRRLRKEGMIKFLQLYVKATLLVLLTRKNLNYRGYIAGGHYYQERRKVKQSVVKHYEKKVKKLLADFLSE